MFFRCGVDEFDTKGKASGDNLFCWLEADVLQLRQLKLCQERKKGMLFSGALQTHSSMQQELQLWTNSGHQELQIINLITTEAH